MSSAIPKIVPDLKSCRQKLKWADTNFETLNSDVKKWVRRKPYAFIRQPSPNGITHEVFIHVKEEPDVENWSLRLADCLHNLRTVLDHFAFSLVASKGQPFNERRIAFPICDDDIKFGDAINRGCLETVDVLTFEAFQNAQPYNRPEQGSMRPLSFLRDCDDFNKHRLLQIVSSLIDHGELWPPICPENREVTIVEGPVVYIGPPIVDGMKFMEFTVSAPCKNLQYDPNFTPDIFVQLPGITGNKTWSIDWAFAVIRYEITSVLNDLMMNIFDVPFVS